MKFTILAKNEDMDIIFEEEVEAETLSEALDHVAFYYTGDRFK